MKYYSINEQTKEVLINTLRQFDYLDNITPSYPLHSIIHDTELPKIDEKQTYIAVGDRTSYTYTKNELEITINNVLLVSKNIEIVEDHRGEKYFSTVDGSEVEIKKIGSLPDHITPQPRPDIYYVWGGESWVIDQVAKDEMTKQINVARLESETNRTSIKIDTIKPAVDGGYADDEDIVLLPLLNKYRYQLSKVPNQNNWPLEVDWPDAPNF